MGQHKVPATTGSSTGKAARLVLTVVLTAVAGALVIGSASASFHGAAAVRCSGQDATIVGTPGDDVLSGTSGPDVIAGLDGNDTIDALGGDDVICGDAGDDVVAGGPGRELINDGPGNDSFDGGAGYDGISHYFAPNGVSSSLAAGGATGWGDDTLTRIEAVQGSGFADVLVGDSRNNEIYPGRGNDRVDGGAGFDWVSYADSRKGVNVDLSARRATGMGTDRLRSIEAAAGSDEWDKLRGDRRDNAFDGFDGSDVIFGKRGNDRIWAGPGDDIVLDGGAGRDMIDGGEGFDVCVNGERNPNCELLARPR